TCSARWPTDQRGPAGHRRSSRSPRPAPEGRNEQRTLTPDLLEVLEGNVVRTCEPGLPVGGRILRPACSGLWASPGRGGHVPPDLLYGRSCPVAGLTRHRRRPLGPASS